MEKVAQTVERINRTANCQERKGLNSQKVEHEFHELITEHRNIHENARAMIRGIRLVYGKAQNERGVNTSSEKVTPIQNTNEKKAGRRLHGQLKGPTGQQTVKRKKSSTPKKCSS